MNKSLIYIIRRLGFYLIAAFAALTLNFVIPRLMPGDPASIIFARFKGKMTNLYGSQTKFCDFV